MNTFSSVEQHFFKISQRKDPSTTVPYIVVENFPKLGFLTALRFVEWVNENPEGVISLPTGKTPEYFIKWIHHLKANWNDKALTRLRLDNGLAVAKMPDFHGLQFVQIDEFFPIDPRQHNSFYHYVREYYIKGFGLDEARAQLINCAEIPTAGGRSLSEIFPDHKVDLSLRYRDCKACPEQLQQQTIFMVDQWCSEYEDRIRAKGGIGFFLGGIGPDGHIAFNVRGSDHNSTTRLMETNFETQAAAAGDLGGIEISQNRLVITIGLSTITANPAATAIIIAAGEAKAPIVRDSLEKHRDILYPATVLQNLANSRFYLTQGAASALRDSQDQLYFEGEWNPDKTQRAVINLAVGLNKFGRYLTVDDLRADCYCSRIPDIDENTVPDVLINIVAKLDRGLELPVDQSFYHTGPHHDDIMLGYAPHVMHLVRTPRNKHHFSVMTSGFTSVTNSYVIKILDETLHLLESGQIQMTDYPDFFNQGYKFKRDKDVYHYLDKIASRNVAGQRRGLCHRVVRALVEIYSIDSKSELAAKIRDITEYLRGCYDGEKNPPRIQSLKGMIREFEEELVWAHLGVRVRDVSHLRLGFYTGDVFTEQPDRKRDIPPILEQLQKINPTVITLALDPEGSGPDTHYKVLQAIAEAIREWGKETDLNDLKIWGYRNVWYRFDPADADIIIPVSLNTMSVFQSMFLESYLSQKEASFPSYKYDGPFSDLAQRIWVDQHQQLELLLGKDFWYQNEHPRLRAAHGLIFMRELSVQQFLNMARNLEKSMEGQIG
ncbi:MAG: glucosamine-6-phosphate isomerase [Candidatus Neomarinimicrobiota bacterium]